jgi:hypothetical protein
MAKLKISEYLGTEYIGELYSLDQFIETNKCGAIIPYDGSISEILINGYKTNIVVDDWGMWKKDDSLVLMELYNLKLIPGNVEILWCEK